MAQLIAICTSREKGTRKEAGTGGVLRENYGLEGDAHASRSTHRQVSLLDIESINKVKEAGLDIRPGDFAENLTVQGLDLSSLPVGTRISIGKEALLEVTQIGKKCHRRCAIYQQIGKCIMPNKGIFARVIRGGFIKAGDQIKIEET